MQRLSQYYGKNRKFSRYNYSKYRGGSSTFNQLFPHIITARSVEDTIADLVGKTLSNRYHVVEFLGRGGMAEVYKVWDSDRMIHMAAKVLLKSLAMDKVFLRRFQREADALAGLQHPNIVRFYGMARDESLAFMLLDFIEGTTLQEVIFNQGAGIDPNQILSIIRPICSALHYAHRQGMVHCDIKPGNIMINQQGQAFLTDFGIARMTDAATATMVGFGTPAYMAPELILGQDPTPASDIYSLGIVLFEMATGGERPFTGEQAPITGPISEKVRWEQVNLTPPTPRSVNPNITPALESVILKCLAKAPEKRYASTLEFANALEIALENFLYTPVNKSPQPQITVPQHPKSTAYRPQRIAESERYQPAALPENNGQGSKWLIAAGFGLIALIIVGFILLKQTQPPSLSLAQPSASAIVQPIVDSPTQIIQPTTNSSTLIITEIVPTNTPILINPTAVQETPTESNIALDNINPIDSAELVFVDAGWFLMGSEDQDAWDNEKPEHSVYLDSYWIYKYEVTNQQFAAFVDATGYQTTAEQAGESWVLTGTEWEEIDAANWTAPRGPGSSIQGLDNHPVVHMSWYDASAYCAWAGGRLPTEAEWENAASGEENYRFPWGNAAPNCSLANYKGCIGGTKPVGQYPAGASPYGALDMVGNVWEWTADWYSNTYYSVSPDTNPQGPPDGTHRVLRGGSWASTTSELPVSGRFRDLPTYTDDNDGFRCVIDANN